MSELATPVPSALATPPPETNSSTSSAAEGSHQPSAESSNTLPAQATSTSALAKRSTKRLLSTPAPIDDYYFMRIVAGRDPTAVYGFILDLPCRLRWAKYYYQELYDDDLSSLPLEEAAEELTIMEKVSREIIPRMIYHEFRSLPRVQDTLLPIDPEPGSTKFQYVFALRDNSSKASETVALRKADVLGVRRRLGLGDQMPKWYEMYRCVQSPTIIHHSDTNSFNS
ncbi:hypothetical protein C8Q76DRAFT_714939, partial [Earliella scabrosa]